jgi:pilus assembly protein Flp/PilA
MSRLLRDESGATMAEYGLMVALIAVVNIAVVTLLGQHVSTFFHSAATTI